MKKIFFLFIIITFAVNVFPQRKANIGVFAGTSYYMGDINPNKHFYRPKISLGGLYRYNFNKFYALRLNAYYSELSGSDTDFPQLYHTSERYFHPSAFNTSLLDIALQLEFNFFPYIPDLKRWDATPYIAGGLGYSLILSSSSTGEAANPHLTIPFGIGMKITLSKRVSAGLEWSFRKTANDRVDGVLNDIDHQSAVHNNDWYSFAGVFITYKIFNFAVDCPVYE